MADDWFEKGTVPVGNAKTKEEPGWFQPGSKSEAAVRGFSQAATLGFGDELQAYLRAVAGGEDGKSYLERVRALKEQERAANARSATENPLSYVGGSVAGALPQALNISAVAKTAPTIAAGAARGVGTGGLYGAMQGAGNAETIADIPKEAAIQAAIGAGTGALQGGAAVSNVGRVPGQRVMDAAKPLKDVGDRLIAGSKMSQAEKVAQAAKSLAEKQTASPGSDIGREMVRGVLTGGGFGGGALYGGSKQDWSDPLTALGNTALHAGAGAALGRVSANAPLATEVFVQGVKPAVSGLTTMATTLPKVAGAAALDAPSASFGALRQYLAQLPEEEKRKKAMELSQTPGGRALGNGDSPVTEDDWFSQGTTKIE